MKHFFFFQNSLLQCVAHIIPSVIYTKLQNVFKPRCKISSEDGPLNFQKDIVVASGEAVLECVGKIWIESVADSCVSIRNTIVFSPRITLSNNRNT